MTRRKLLHPCRECKRRGALFPIFAVCRPCFDKSLKRVLDPFEAGIRDLATWLDRELRKKRAAAKGAGR